MKVKNMIYAFIVLQFLILLSATGCSEERDPSVSFYSDESAVSDTIKTNFRYQSSDNPNYNLKTLFEDQCIKCHSPEVESSVPLTTYLEIYTRGVFIRRSVQPGGTMQKYSNFEYDKLIEWIEAGMPQ